MTIQELDRLVSKTDLTPVAKQALREVRRGVMTGRVGDPEVSTAEWKVGYESRNGQSLRFVFSLKRV